MENKPPSEAPVAMEDTTAALHSTATNIPPKRTILKPTASKLSSLTRPTSTSAAKTSTSSSTLNKPPTRPPITSSIKKPASTTTSSALPSGHQKRTSVSSVDAKASGDEKKAGGLSARPKRMSLAPSTSTSNTKPAPSTISRRSTVQPSPTPEKKPFVRQSTLSPTKTMKTPTTPGSRTLIGSAARSRLLPSSSPKTANTVADGKKRLSTIPASPTVRTEANDEDKENLLQPVPETSDYADEDESMEAGLDEEHSAPALDMSQKDSHDEEAISALSAELAESQAIVGSLSAELEEWKDKLAAFSASAEEESYKVEAATEAIRNLHAAKIESMTSSHQQELSALTNQLEEAKADVSALEQRISTIDSQQASHESAFQELEQTKARDIETLKHSHANDLSGIQTQLDEATKISTNAATQHDAEVKKLGDVIKTLQNEILKRHESQAQEADSRILAIRGEHEDAMSKALANAKATSSDEVEALRSLLSADFKARIDSLQKEFAEARESARKSSEEVQTASEEQIRALEAQSRSASSDLQAAKMQVNTLKSILSSLEKESQEKEEEHAKELAKEREDMEMSVKRMADQQMKLMDAHTRLSEEAAKRNALEETHAKAISDLKAEHEVGKTDEIKALKRQYAEHLAGFSQKEDDLTKKTEKTLSQLIELKEAFDAQGDSHGQTITEMKSQHEAAAKLMQDAATTKDQELEELRSSQAGTDKLSKAMEASHAQALQDLEAKHARVLRDLESEASSRAEELKQLRSHQESQAEKAKTLESTHIKELEKLKDEHAGQTLDLQAAAEGKANEMEAMKLQHAGMLRDLKTSLDGRHSEVEALNSQNADLKKDMKAVESAHLVHLEEVRARHAEALADTKATADVHAAELAKWKSQHEQLTMYAESSKNAHTQALEHMKSHHAYQIKTLQESVDTQTAEAKKWKIEHGHAVKGSKTKADSLTRQFEELNAKHAEELRLAKTTSDAHAGEIKKLKTLHSSAVDDATGAQTTALTDANNRIAELRKELEKLTEATTTGDLSQTEMRSELNGALLEVETQRSIAERLREDAKGVDEMMKGLRDRVATLEAEVTEAKKAPKTKKKSGGKGKKSGSLPTPGANGVDSSGLAESKWAQDKEMTSSVVPELRGGSGGEETGEKKYNIEGKLAGMQEQLKQLDDINNDFLEEHEKMARTLSRVDDKPAAASAEK